VPTDCRPVPAVITVGAAPCYLPRSLPACILPVAFPVSHPRLHRYAISTLLDQRFSWLILVESWCATRLPSHELWRLFCSSYYRLRLCVVALRCVTYRIITVDCSVVFHYYISSDIFDIVGPVARRIRYPIRLLLSTRYLIVAFPIARFGATPLPFCCRFSPVVTNYRSTNYPFSFCYPWIIH